jgi:hypothetical protein
MIRNPYVCGPQKCFTDNNDKVDYNLLAIQTMSLFQD